MDTLMTRSADGHRRRRRRIVTARGRRRVAGRRGRHRRAANVNLFYGEKQALFDITSRCKKNAVTAFIGPSGCGKSTLLRCLNRMNDLIDGVRIDGHDRDPRRGHLRARRRT